LINRNLLTGLLLTLFSAAAFGTSGALAKGLLATGWSPAAAVIWRVSIGALVLAVPAVLSMRGRWHVLRRGWRTVLLFGLMAIAVCQLAYFLAVARLSVAVALLLEFSGVLLVVGWLWFRRGERPRPLNMIGSATCLAGLMLILDVFGAVQIDPVGVIWGLVAAAGLAPYFIVAADDSHGIPPLFVAAGGLTVGAAALFLAGLTGVVTLSWSTADVVLAGFSVPWWLDVAILGVVAAAFAYLSGIGGSRRLGSKLASFVGLSEVLFAVLWAGLLLQEMPVTIQLVGGGLILAGVAVVRLDEAPQPVAKPAAVVSRTAAGSE
jgi:drug/metabolite transporter (DMT)-like permease